MGSSRSREPGISIQFTTDIHGIVMSSPFFGRMSAMDLRARGAAGKDHYRRAYLAAVVPFTEEEKRAVMTALRGQPSVVSYAGATVDLGHVVRVVKLAAGTENNWPHTLGDVICLPAPVLGSPDLGRVLLHERVHVWQRANTLAMGRIIVSQGYVAAVVPPRAVNNPDTDGKAYALAGVVPLLSYKVDTPRSMQDSFHANGGDHPYEMMASRIAS
jgi:hypothetical protein